MHAVSDCIFCKIVAGEIPCFKLYENEESLAFMDINPVSSGHCLIVPKQHGADLLAISDAGLCAAACTAKKVARAVKATLDTRGLNLLQCNGEAAGQSVLHFHIHIIPREMDDGMAMNWDIVPGDMAAIGVLAEQIRNNIED